MNDWRKRPLGELCSVVAGGTPSRSISSYFNGGIPWVKIGDMLQGTVAHTEETISAEGLKNSSAKILPAGTVLISIFATIGRTAVLGVEAATNQAIAGLTPNPGSGIIPSFLRYFLDFSVAQLVSEARGVAQLNINGKILKSLQVPVPPLDEQERIVALLDEADALRKLRAQADKRTADLIPALFHDMFGDPATNPMGWPTCCAGELMTKCEYGTSQKADEDGSGVPILRMGNVTFSGNIDLMSLKTVRIVGAELSKYKLEAGDVLFNRTNSRELVGKTGMWDGRFEAVAASYFIRLRFNPTRETPEHFVTFMNLPFMKRQLHSMARGAVGQANINAKELQSIRIPVPSLLSQEAFVNRILQVRVLRNKSLSAGRATESAFDAILYRFFSERQ